MHPSTPRRLITRVAAAAVISLGAASAIAGRPSTADAWRQFPTSTEVPRLRAHFDSVRRELLARDVSALSPAQRAARLRHVTELRAYSDRGVFPHNHDFPNERVPYFRDEHGTLCAMAQLIAASGRTDIVDRVARTRNNAYIGELVDDPALVAWLDSAGLTAAEAARIQPSYGGPGLIVPAERSNREVAQQYALASMVAVGLGGASIALNLREPSAQRAPWREMLGIGAGALGFGLSAAKLGESGTVATLAAANGVVGFTAIALGARNLMHRPSPPIATTQRDRLTTARELEHYDRLAAARGYGLTR